MAAMNPEQQRQSRTADDKPTRGWVALDDLATLRFDGTDVTGFLQGYLTIDTTALGTDPQFTGMCNIKGRVVCSGCVWLEDGGVILVLHRSLCAVVRDFMRPYLAFSKTNMAAMPARVIGFLGANPPCRACQSLSGGCLDDDRHLFALPRHNHETTTDMAGQGHSSVEAVVDMAAGIQDSDVLGGLSVLDRHRWDEALIDRGEVWLQTTTSGHFLPQMLGLVDRGAVSFSKGCYLGQEVVARAQHRGKVKRGLGVLAWSGGAPAVGTAIEANGREVGTVVATAGGGGNGRALTVLVRDQSGPFASPLTATRFAANSGL